MTATNATINEVGPRDGLQNENINISTSEKIALIEDLAKTGITQIEATSFVSTKWVPNLADAEQVMNNLKRSPNVTYSALVPNKVGLERAIKCNINKVAFFTAASEQFTLKNINCSINDSVENFKNLVVSAKSHTKQIRAYISCIHTCPYEGKIKADVVASLAEKLYNIGCTEIALGDTTGTASPDDINKILKAVINRVPKEKIAVHFHDTYNNGLANISTSLDLGIDKIDSAIAGLGGCPYSPGSSGNVATEDVVHMLNNLGIKTGVNLEKLIKVSNAFASKNNLKNRARSSRTGV
ncbi:MAG: hydroxymethylglutaryl-CoA lyase [Legionellales bacterium]|nr:hydroxymethylglutaryl-CoA lyase [Legionellales bacterium]